MKKEYSDCYFCGGAVEERLLPREVRWQGQLLVLENVPMGVCVQCGEKVLKPEVTKAIDRILQDGEKPTRTMRVPVYHLEPEMV